MHDEYSDNQHTFMANAAIWLVNLKDMFDNLLDIFVKWYNNQFTIEQTMI